MSDGNSRPRERHPAIRLTGDRGPDAQPIVFADSCCKDESVEACNAAQHAGVEAYPIDEISIATSLWDLAGLQLTQSLLITRVPSAQSGRGNSVALDTDILFGIR